MRATPEPDAGTRPLRRVARAGWLVAGLVCVALGLVGALLPLMPTTIFLIAATGCFARSSPRLEAWLLGHHRFGATIRAWRDQRAMSRRAKIAACTGIAAGYLLFLIGARPGMPLAASVAVAMAAIGLYLLTRPSPQPPF